MYITSIIIVCFLNNSLPIGFTFSNGEKKVSNQGKALIVLCQDRSIFYLKFIRHLLAGLKYDPYSYEIDQLVQYSSKR